MAKKPIYKTQNKTLQQEELYNTLKQSHSEILAHIYSNRNLTAQDLDLSQKLVHFKSLKNATKAAAILFNFIQANKKICIVSDYDADGATACSIGLLGLQMFNANVSYIVPNRFVHGYGLTPTVIEEAIDKIKPDLLVTVDNGISSVEGVDYANSKNIPVLITDHHLVGEVLPNALCIVNPNLPDCTFESKNLAGCGVIFYILCALRQHYIDCGIYNTKNAPNVFSLLDLVAIGTIADVVPLDINNRIMISLGLKYIQNNKTRPGILALIETCKKQHHTLNSSDISFYVAPQINAAGRLEDMSIGIQCLTTNNNEDAKLLAKRLHKINIERKSIENKMKEIALCNQTNTENQNTIQNNTHVKTYYHPSYHEGVVGILASRLKDLHYLPTIVFADSKDETLLKGSGRSIQQIHLRDALDYVYKKSNNIIVKFGGHSAAAGLTIYKNKLQEFSSLFNEAVKYYANNKDLNNIKIIDLELPQEYITIENAKIITSQIWGQGLPPPIFKGKFKILSQHILSGSHLKVRLEIEQKEIEGIWFFKKTPLDQEQQELVYSLSINEFNGTQKIQLLIEGQLDLK